MFSVVVLGVVVSLTVASLFWIKITRVQAQEHSQPTWQHPGKLIDNTAMKLSAENEDSVRAVADEIFNYPHAFGRMPSDIESVVKEHLVQAEIAFRHGKRSGVREEDVVKLLNQMGDTLGLPSYAKTTPKQVRVIRMSLMLESPHFMAAGTVRPDMQIGQSISSEMSVLQAAHVAQVVLDQKFINPDFQVNPSEWDQEFHQKAIDKIKKAEAIRQAGQSDKLTHHTFSRSNPKRAEMDQAFFSGVSSLASQDALSLISRAFTTLRINQ